MLTECFSFIWLQLIHYLENWSVVSTRSSPVAGMELQVSGCGMQVAATPKCALLCVLSSRCLISCVVLCHICCCCGVAAPCVAAIVTVRMNQKNFSEASLSWISTARFILVSLLLLKSNFVCLPVFVYRFYLGWEFWKLVILKMVLRISCEYKRDLKCKTTLPMYKMFIANQRLEPCLLTQMLGKH
jgi:hypothetical protein